MGDTWIMQVQDGRPDGNGLRALVEVDSEVGHLVEVVLAAADASAEADGASVTDVAGYFERARAAVERLFDSPVTRGRATAVARVIEEVAAEWLHVDRVNRDACGLALSVWRDAELRARAVGGDRGVHALAMLAELRADPEARIFTDERAWPLEVVAFVERATRIWAGSDG